MQETVFITLSRQYSELCKDMVCGAAEKRNAGYGEYLHKHPNLLNRDFKTEKINQEWVTGSYTCTPSEEGVLVGHQRSVSELRKM